MKNQGLYYSLEAQLNKIANTSCRCRPFSAPFHSRIVVLNCGVVAIDFLPVLSMYKTSEGFLLKNEDKITIS